MLRRHLTYANVVATLCLFIVLGGGAYAATKLPKNSVGAKQISAGAVRSPEVRNGSLLRKDFKAGEVPAGSQGPAGPAGERGPAGPTGPAGSAAQLSCPAGTLLQSGFCFETVVRPPATWDAAAGVCAAAGRRLASPSELWAVAARADVLMESPELTTTVYRDANGSTSYGLVTTIFEFGPGAPQTGIRKTDRLDDMATDYRCVVNPGSA
jgi:hypothetical protein